MTMKVIDWLEKEPFTLALSPGFFGFFSHAGFLSAFEEAGLTPKKIGGCSSGALVSGCYAAGVSARDLKDFFFKLQKRDFWDPGFGMGLLKGRAFRRILRELCPIKELQACPVPLSVAAYDVLARETHVLSQGFVDKVIYASCAVPGLFHPLRINGRWYIDGATVERTGLVTVEPEERVFYHYITTPPPWQWDKSKQHNAPVRNDLLSVSVYNLPAIGPNNLQDGKKTFHHVKEQTLRAFEMPVAEDMAIKRYI